MAKTEWAIALSVVRLVLASIAVAIPAAAQTVDTIGAGSVFWLSTSGVGRTVETFFLDQPDVLRVRSQITIRNAGEFCERYERLNPNSPQHRACAKKIVDAGRQQDLLVNCRAQTITFDLRTFDRINDTPLRDQGNDGRWRDRGDSNSFIRADDLYRRSCAYVSQVTQSKAREREEQQNATRIVLWVSLAILIGVVLFLGFARRSDIANFFVGIRQTFAAIRPAKKLSNGTVLGLAVATLIVSIFIYDPSWLRFFGGGAGTSSVAGSSRLFPGLLPNGDFDTDGCMNTCARISDTCRTGAPFMYAGQNMCATFGDRSSCVDGCGRMTMCTNLLRHTRWEDLPSQYREQCKASGLQRAADEYLQKRR